MAFYDSTWYCNFGNGTSTGYYAVTVRPQNTAVAAGVLRRQFTAPAVGSERVFVCIVAGTTANTTDATWVLTRGAKTTDGTATWQECTGASAVNGDLTNTASWATAKATGTPTLGAIIKRNNGASYQICTTAGTMAASEPSFSDTAGVTTNDGTSVWTCIGPVGNFTGGQAPFARLASACASTWFVAGNTVYVGDNHAESQTTLISISPSLLQTTTSKIVCHDHSGSYPPTSSNLATTATISTTAAVGISFLAGTGSIYVYGLTFAPGVGASTGAPLVLGATTGNNFYLFDNCVFKIATTSSTQYMDIGNAGTTGNVITWNNCQVSFAAVTQHLQPNYVNFIWQNTGQVLAAGSSVPNALINSRVAGYNSNVTLEALDLSQVTSVFGVTFTATGNWGVKDCKLNASPTFSTPLGAGQTFQYIRSDSGATAYKSARYAYEGSETTETSITRVGGASDPTGQAQSRKIVTTANVQWLRPFKAEEYAIWNATTGTNVTVTVYGTINSASLPRNSEIWMEAEFLGSSATPIGSIVSTTIANLLTADAAVASDGSTWNGGGSGGGWSPFKLTTTLSSPQPAMAGYLNVRVRAAKASTTYYVDPKIELT